MARPRKNDTKTEAVLIRMDKSLDGAIRDFMKTQEVTTKSEAIRELIGLGILHYFIMTNE